MNFRGFSAALFSDWVGRMSGLGSLILAVAGFTIPEYLKYSPFTDAKLFWLLGLICFFIAAGHVWTVERGKVLAATDTTLSGQIDLLLTADVVKGSSDLTGFVYIMAGIKNIGGADSIADSYRLRADIESTQVWGVAFLHIALLQKLNEQLQSLDYSMTSFLPDKTAEHPIPKGGLRRGWMTFKFSGLAAEQLRVATLTLSFKDVRGKEYSCVFNEAHPTSELTYHPHQS